MENNHTHIPIASGHITWHGKIPPTEEQMKMFEEMASKAMLVAVSPGSKVEPMYNKAGGFQYFQVVHGKWSDETFGIRTPLPSLHHLKKEVQEVIDEPHDLEEYADCFMLLIDSARIAGFSMVDILDAMWLKFEKNKNRQWGAPDENGTVEHIR